MAAHLKGTRATTPRRAWTLSEHFDGELVLLACPHCGATSLWNVRELKPLAGRNCACKVCGDLAQLPDPERFYDSPTGPQHVHDPEAVHP